MRQGFEPWVGVYPLQRFSKPPLSATQPPHRGKNAKYTTRLDSGTAQLTPGLSLKLSLTAFKSRAGTARSLACRGQARTPRFFVAATTTVTRWKTTACETMPVAAIADISQPPDAGERDAARAQ